MFKSYFLLHMHDIAQQDIAVRNILVYREEESLRFVIIDLTTAVSITYCEAVRECWAFAEENSLDLCLTEQLDNRVSSAWLRTAKAQHYLTLFRKGPKELAECDLSEILPEAQALSAWSAEPKDGRGIEGGRPNESLDNVRIPEQLKRKTCQMKRPMLHESNVESDANGLRFVPLGPRRSQRLQVKAAAEASVAKAAGNLEKKPTSKLGSNSRRGSVKKAGPARKAKAIKELASGKLARPSSELRRSARLAEEQSAAASERIAVLQRSDTIEAASNSRKRSADTAFSEETCDPAARPVKRYGRVRNSVV